MDKTIREYIEEYGITLDESDTYKKWSDKNLRVLLSSLRKMDQALKGNLKSLINGTTLRINEYVPPPGSDNRYGGRYSNQTITFSTLGTEAIRQMNIFHEFGHFVDDRNGHEDEFSDKLDALDDPSFIGDDDYINPDALISDRPYDPNHGDAQARQASGTEIGEQWADVFANYVAGNIDLTSSGGEGADMNRFVTKVLSPYSNPNPYMSP